MSALNGSVAEPPPQTEPARTPEISPSPARTAEIGPDALCHRFALASAAVSFLPIVMGALTTTYGAGMAFPDWPTSAGENMFTYDLVGDVKAGDLHKVLEHGHRLAGATLGFVVLLATGVFAFREKRPPVKGLMFGVLGGVIVQGLLGGVRVTADSPELAAVHGLFGSFVFTAIVAAAVVTSRPWFRIDEATEGKTPNRGLITAGIALIVAVVAQYALGGLVRHLGLGLHTHMGSAVLVFGGAIYVGVLAIRTRKLPLRRIGVALHTVVTVQVALGLAAWWTKYQPLGGGVIVADAPAQVWSRSLHAITGMLLLAASVVLVMLVVRIRRGTTGQGGDVGETLAAVSAP